MSEPTVPASWVARDPLYLVTDGYIYAYWYAGHWQTTEVFGPKCLLTEYQARAARDVLAGCIVSVTLTLGDVVTFPKEEEIPF